MVDRRWSYQGRGAANVDCRLETGGSRGFSAALECLRATVMDHRIETPRRPALCGLQRDPDKREAPSPSLRAWDRRRLADWLCSGRNGLPVENRDTQCVKAPAWQEAWSWSRQPNLPSLRALGPPVFQPAVIMQPRGIDVSPSAKTSVLSEKFTASGLAASAVCGVASSLR